MDPITRTRIEIAAPAPRRVYRSAPISAEKRERLILEHSPQVRLIASRIKDRLPVSVCLEDLVSAGIAGLMSAIDGFDSVHNVTLRTYAEYKIRAAILDGLRGLDWAPRRRRGRFQRIEAAIGAAEQLLRRTPTEDEIATQLNLSLAEYREWLIEIPGLHLGGLRTALSGDADHPRNPAGLVASGEEQWPLPPLERSELQRLLAEAISRMPEPEKTVLGLYYDEELTLLEISRIVHLHESRISQLKSQGVLRLRAYMLKRWPARES